jgi:hypothetical protein
MNMNSFSKYGDMYVTVFPQNVGTSVFVNFFSFQFCDVSTLATIDMDFLSYYAHSGPVIDTRCLLQAQNVHNRTLSL